MRQRESEQSVAIVGKISRWRETETEELSHVHGKKPKVPMKSPKGSLYD